MKTAQQRFSFDQALKKEFGGSLSKGRRKTLRPITTRSPMHVVMRASQAQGRWSLLHHKWSDAVDRLVGKIARKHGVKIQRYANVGNHIHLLVIVKRREALQRFLRELPGAIAMMITGARKSSPLSKRFWDQTAYSRIVEWGRDVANLRRYFIKNYFEAEGLLTRAMKVRGFRIVSMLDGPLIS